MNDKINLNVLARDGDALFAALDCGDIVAARSKGHFLYILISNGCFQLFSHTTGAANGGKKSFPIDEKHRAVVKNLATVADALYAIGFDAGMNLYGVMASAEEAICAISAECGVDGDDDITFVIPGEEA
ncbi:MAG: hypothetical protein LBS24_02470 [Clostridiales Family XIII bacterium]|jgi:hypothetical protein|nr:hypothetical protein [Clostridiales Family XIII bacterium]